MISNRPTNSDSFEVEYNIDSNVTSSNGAYNAHNAAAVNGIVGRYPIAYTCKQLLSNNEAGDVEVEFYYELVRNKADDENDVMHRAETDTLNSVAAHFGLDNGARCSVPPVNVMWLVRISSQPDDEPVNILPCEFLKPGDNQICLVYHGLMTGYALGASGTTDLIEYLRDFLHTAPSDNSYRMAFLGTQIDTSALAEISKTNLPPAYNAVNQEVVQEREPRQVTVLGGFLVALFALAVVGILLVLYRRRRKWLTAQDVEMALSKSQLDEPAEASPKSSSRRKVERSTEPRRVERHLVEVGSDAIEESPSSPDGAGGYTFDLGASMKNDMFGVHGGHTSGKPPRTTQRPSSDVSMDSDADSWAQTDGTIGSLEQQLDPITAEV